LVFARRLFAFHEEEFAAEEADAFAAVFVNEVQVVRRADVAVERKGFVVQGGCRFTVQFGVFGFLRVLLGFFVGVDVARLFVGIEDEEAGGAPQRRRGASVVLIDGAPVLYASDSLKVLISYTSEREVLTRALSALATARQGALAHEGSPPGRHRTVVESLNGVSALDRAVSDLLRQAGFVSDPRGMRLAVGPYGASFSR